MSYPLAVFAPIIGGRTETFIRRHMQELLPGGTVVVADTSGGPFGGHWSVDCPSLVLSQIQHDGLKRKIVQSVARKLGFRPEDHSVKNVRRFLRRHQVQVIMGEFLDWSEPWLEVAQASGIRFFGHAHGYDISVQLRDPKWQAEYLRYNQADGVITISEISRARLVDMGLDAAKIHVISYGVDVPSQPFTRDDRETIRCVAVGRMVAKKAPILTLDAFRRAAEICPGLRLDYIGAGELLPAARQFVRAFNLGDRVTLYGGQHREEVHRLMTKADIFLQHSMTDPETGDAEGLPVAILEAMANNLPVVSTRHAGIMDAVLDSATGYLVEEEDSVGMAECIITLARDPDLRRRMGEAGWRRAKEHFSWEKERTELLRILRLA